MKLSVTQGSNTPQSLLARVRNLRDEPAWIDFYSRYDPLLRRFSARLNLDAQTADEVCSIAWDKLSVKIQTFEYDPGRKFRHWLWIFFRHQAFDFLKKQKRERELPVDFSSEDEERRLLPTWTDRLDDDELEEQSGELASKSRDSDRQNLREQARAVQQKVQAKVKETTWQAYWRVAIEGKTFDEAAKSLGMTYLAVFKSVARVRQMLKTEGQKYLLEPGTNGPGLDES